MISDNNRWISVFFILFIFIGCVVFIASFGIRGCDQYWYVADVESLMNNKHVTNYLYSGLVVRDNSYLDNPQFIHNILSLYLALPFAFVFGPFAGWIFMNLIMSLLSGLLIYYLILKRTNNFLYALLGLELFLLNPVTVWQTSQPMAEASITPFIASVMAVSLSRKLDFKAAAAIIILLCIAHMVREIFLPSLVIFLFIYYMVALKDKPLSFSFRHFTGLVLIEMVMLKLKEFLFGISVFRVDEMLKAALSNKKSTDFVFGGGIVLSQIRLLDSNILKNLVYQFFADNGLFLLYIIFNLLMFVLFYRIKSHDADLSLVVYMALMLLLNYFIFIALHQNQFRYTLIPYPAVVLGSILVIERYFSFSGITLRRLFYFICVFCLALLAPMIMNAKKTAASDYVFREKIVRLMGVVKSDDRVLMCVAKGQYNLSYAARPRKMIFTEIHSQKDYIEKVIRLAQPDWVLCDARVLDKIESDKRMWIVTPVNDMQYGETKYILASFVYR